MNAGSLSPIEVPQKFEYRSVFLRVINCKRKISYPRPQNFTRLLLLAGMDMKFNLSEGRIESASFPQELLPETSFTGRQRGLIEAFASFKEVVEKLEPFYESLRSEFHLDPIYESVGQTSRS